MPTIFWACAILFVYIYMAAVVGLVLTDPFYDAHVAAGFESKLVLTSGLSANMID